MNKFIETLEFVGDNLGRDIVVTSDENLYQHNGKDSEFPKNARLKITGYWPENRAMLFYPPDNYYSIPIADIKLVTHDVALPKHTPRN